MLYVIRGRESKDVPGKAEEWRIARLNPCEQRPQVQDLAIIPFASRSLTFDSRKFWSNHRVANETISFAVPSTMRPRSHYAVIRVYDAAGNLIETHEHAGEFKGIL